MPLSLNCFDPDVPLLSLPPPRLLIRLVSSRLVSFTLLSTPFHSSLLLSPLSFILLYQSIILLPIQIKLVFLSATIPNSLEFAQWVANLKGLPCNVVQTDFRPTPLQHFMFPAGGNGIFLILDEAGNFLEDNFIKMMTLQDSRAESKTKGKEQPDIIKLVSFVADRGMCPAIVFAFSRRECEALALQTSRCKSLRLVGESQVLSIKEVFEKALQGLAKEDQELPQIQNILPLLCCGIGVHHSGLLPILRELIEILFQEGLVKVEIRSSCHAPHALNCGLAVVGVVCNGDVCSRAEHASQDLHLHKLSQV